MAHDLGRNSTLMENDPRLKTTADGRQSYYKLIVITIQLLSYSCIYPCLVYLSKYYISILGGERGLKAILILLFRKWEIHKF